MYNIYWGQKATLSWNVKCILRAWGLVWRHYGIDSSTSCLCGPSFLNYVLEKPTTEGL